MLLAGQLGTVGSSPAPANVTVQGIWEQGGEDFWGNLTQDVDFAAWTYFCCQPGKILLVVSVWWRDSGEEVARSWLQWETAPASGAEVTALPYFTEAKWVFLNLLKSKDLQAFLICALAARERTVPVGRSRHKRLPTAWDGVCVFWFGFLIIFLQSVHGPPSGALWIAGCPWAPWSNAELDDCYLRTYAALEAL